MIASRLLLRRPAAAAPLSARALRPEKTSGMEQDLHDYVVARVREPPLLQRLRAETAALGDVSIMQISPDQGAFLRILAGLLGARRVLELGTFTGYSSLCMAAGMAADGSLTTFDVSDEWTAVARRYWKEAGVADRVDLRLTPAMDGLGALEPGSFDLAFLDADKENYPAYYERLVSLVRVGGVVAVDNVLWSGRVAMPEEQDAETEAIRALNDIIAADERVEVATLPLADGLTLARRVL